MSTELPPGWVHVRLGDILLKIEAGRSFTCEPRRAEPGEWGIIKVSAMTWGKFDEDENKAIPAHRQPDPRFEIRPQDILVSRANTEAYVGAPVLVGECRPRLLLSDKSLRLIPGREIDRRWLVHALSSPLVRGQISEKSTGAQESMRNISQSSLAEVEIPLPPLAEQHRIVEALEDHLSRLDAGIANLASALRKLALLQERLLDLLANPLQSSESPQERPLGELVTMGSGGTPKSDVRSYYTGDIPWVVSGDLDDSILTDVTGRISENGLRNSSAKWVPSGAILIAMYGATIGKLGIAGRTLTTNQAIAHLVPKDDHTTASYLFWYLRSQRAAFIRAGKGGAQPNISQTVLKAWPVPVPTREEQNDIVMRLESANAAMMRLRQNIGYGENRSVHLRRALLGQALSGMLIPQDATDEPADELLKRTQGERDSRPDSTTPSKRPKTLVASVQEGFPL